MKPGETIEARGVVWTSYGEGHRSPLVILHGLFGSADNWRPQALALAEEGMRVLVADLPNHGYSQHTSAAQMTFASFAARIWGSLEELGVSRVVLLGHSLGGKIAMQMALERSHAVERLIVADIAPRPYPRRHDEIFAGMKRVAAADVSSRGSAETEMQQDIPSRPVRLFLLKSLEVTDTGARWRLNLEGLEEAYPTLVDWPYPTDGECSGLPRYGGPVTVVAGGASPYVESGDEPRFRCHFDTVTVERIADAGHWLHAERRDEFLAIVRAALS